MEDGITVRKATDVDADALFEVTRRSAQALCREHYSAEQLEGWMGDRTAETYRRAIQEESTTVALLGGRIVGYVSAVPGEVRRLFLLPEVAGLGLGKCLMEIGLATAECGADGPVEIEATRNAEAFYRRFGFEKVGDGCFTGRGGGYPPIEIVRMKRRRVAGEEGDNACAT